MVDVKGGTCGSSEEDIDGEWLPLDEDKIKESLEKQIAECEMLESMFSNPDEFSLNYGVLLDAQDYVSGKNTKKPSQLSMVIRLRVGGLKMEVSVDLPAEYPRRKPDLFVRSEQWTRFQQNEINIKLASFVREFDEGEIVIASAIGWVQENANLYQVPEVGDENSGPRPPTGVETKGKSFLRLWIYSHHIYSKMKRKTMLDLARDHELTGFCLPGKPGIMCLEGGKSECEEWWLEIKNMTWKKIMCIKREEYDDVPSITELRKFPVFREISFSGSRVRKQDRHVDFGEFYKFLKESQCEYMFKAYFGMDGK